MRVTSLGQAEQRFPVLEEECISSPSGRIVDDALRLLARMLVAAARKGASSVDLRRQRDAQDKPAGQARLTVEPGTEVH